MSMKSRLKVGEPGSKELEGYEVRDRVHDKCVEMVLEEREGRPGWRKTKGIHTGILEPEFMVDKQQGLEDWCWRVDTIQT